MRIAITGGRGRLGAEAVRSARERGHDVVTIDRFGDDGPDFVKVDLTVYDDVARTLDAGFDAIAHLAGTPGRTQVPGDVIFHNNLIASYNVLRAAEHAAIPRVVYASSETVLGLPFTQSPPYLPVDENVPDRFTSDYGIAKHLEERMARLLAERRPEVTITGLLLTTITLPEMYADFDNYEASPGPRGYNLWSYTDVRDAGDAVALATERSGGGFERVIIAADDSVMRTPTSELIERFHPGVRRVKEFSGNESLFSNARAKELLGFAPTRSWRAAP